MIDDPSFRFATNLNLFISHTSTNVMLPVNALEIIKLNVFKMCVFMALFWSINEIFLHPRCE